MRSLRMRLLAGILLTMVASWSLLFMGYRGEVTRERTTLWDDNLKEVAHMALLSLPTGLRDSVAKQNFALPADQVAKIDKMPASLQVWDLESGHILLRSPWAPTVPLRPDMTNGFSDMTEKGEAWRVYAVSDAEGRVQVQVAKPWRERQEELQQKFFGALIIVAAMFVLVSLVTWAVVHWSLLPATRLSRDIHRRSGSDLQPLDTAGLPVEIGPLVESFNRLLGRLQAAMQGERRFLVDAAHELRTPLAVMTLQTENALRCDDTQEVKRHLQKLLATTQRSARLSEQLLDMARLDADGAADGAATVDLHELLRLVARDFEAMAEARGQRIEVEGEACLIRGHIDPLGILMRNLIDNALRYSGPGGRVEVTCRLARHRCRQEVVLRVADDGPGVAAEARPRIFDRFYRVPGTLESGSGIGLSLVAQIAELHQASIVVDEGLDARGLGVTISFPGAG